MGDNGTPELKLTVTADTKPAEKQVESFGDKFLSIGKVVGAGFAGYLTGRAVVDFIQKSTEAAKQNEAAVRTLNASMIAAGKYTRQASEDFQAYALQLEKSTGIEDNVILKNAALLESVGKLSEDGLKKASKAALDLAAGLQIDVASAFDIMTKATQGNATMLTKYGLELNKRKTEGEKFAQVLDFVNDRFKDFAQTQALSFAGVSNKMANGFGKIEEAVGGLITQSPVLKAAINIIANEFYRLAEAIERIGKRGDFLGGMVDKLLIVAQLLSYISSTFEVAIRVMNAGLLLLPTTMITVYSKVAGVIDGIFGTTLHDKVATLAEGSADLMKSVAAPLASPSELWTIQFGNSLGTMRDQIDATSSKFRNDLPQSVIQGAAEAKTSWDEFVKGFNDGAVQIAGNAKTLGAQVSGTLISGMTNAVSAFGAALVTGKNGFEEFGKGVLKMLGQMCIQIGQFLVLSGLGFSALGFLGFSGAGAVAAGLGLIVLGGVLSAIGGGSGQAEGGTASNVATNTPNTSADALTSSTPANERTKPNTNVVVNVQGNVLDRRATGVELANILNENFDTNGVIVRAVSGVV